MQDAVIRHKDDVGEGSPDVDPEGERRCTHSALILPCFTTCAQRSRSFRMLALKAGPSCGTATNPREANKGSVAGLIGAALLLQTLIFNPGGLGAQLRPLTRWLSGLPFSLHDDSADAGPGAVEGSSVRA